MTATLRHALSAIRRRAGQHGWRSGRKHAYLPRLLVVIVGLGAAVQLAPREPWSGRWASAIASLAQPSSEIVLTVDASRPVRPFTSKMLGVGFVNWEHSRPDRFLDRIPGLAEALRAANVGLLRYAGGNWANSVGFDPTKTQIAPYHSWQHNGMTYWFDYGTDEITAVQRFAQRIEADVMVQVNISNNDPEMWSSMVRYTNAPGKYPVRYWELGNELDLGIGTPKMEASEWASRAIGYQAAMYAVDPTIKMVGAGEGTAVPQAGQNGTLSEFLTTAPQILHDRGRDLDSVSYHWYMENNVDSVTKALRYRSYNADGNPIDRHVWNNSFSRYWADYIPFAVRNLVLNDYPGMTQGITEMSMDAVNYENVYNGNHIAALWFSDVLGRLAYAGMDYVTMYTGYGGQGYSLLYPTLRTYPGGLPDPIGAPLRIDARPSYYAYLMYGQYFGDNLVFSSSSATDSVSIWASMDSKDPGKLKLRVTNVTDRTIATRISLTGFSAGAGLVYVMRSDNPTDTGQNSNKAAASTSINGHKIDAMNVRTSLAAIQPIVIAVDGDAVNYSFPAYSSTAIILNAGGQQ